MIYSEKQTDELQDLDSALIVINPKKIENAIGLIKNDPIDENSSLD